MRKHQWRTSLVSDLRFDSWTSKAVDLAWTLSGATEPIPVNLMHVRLLGEAEDDIFHDSDPSPPADEDNCLLNDALEAMLVDEEPGYPGLNSTPQHLSPLKPQHERCSESCG